jgi:hypothetical protein
MKLSFRGLVFVVVTGLAVLAVGLAMAVNYYSLDLDQAYMVESIDTTFRYWVPLTQLVKSSIEEIRTISSQEAARVCQMSLPLDRGPMMNIFVWHSMPILYLIAPLKWLFDGKAIVAALTSLTFVGMIVILYVAARRKNVPLLAALSFAFLVTAHPAWSYGMFWQFYPDRMFMVFGLLYVITLVSYLEQDQASCAWLMLLSANAVLATLCTERAGIMISGYTLACLFLFRGLHFRWQDLIPASIAVAAAAYVVLYMRLVQNNEFYGSFAAGFLPKVAEILQHGLDPSSVKFLLINGLGIGLLACFHWRLLLVAGGSMLPNLLGSIGGAEKIGWFSHYHTLYFTFLVAAALYGLIRLHRNFPGSAATISASVGMIVCGILLLLINPYETKPLFALSLSNIEGYAPLKVARLITDSDASRAVEVHNAMVRSAAAKVPPGRSVSSVEGMMPALYDTEGGRHISVYPLGLDEVEYLALPFERTSDGQLVLSGAVSYWGPESQRRINECMNERLVRLGFRPSAIIPAVPGAAWGMVVLHHE